MRQRGFDGASALLDGCRVGEAFEKAPGACAPEILERDDGVDDPLSRDGEHGAPSAGAEPDTHELHARRERVIAIAGHRADCVEGGGGLGAGEQQVGAPVGQDAMERTGVSWRMVQKHSIDGSQVGRGRNFAVMQHREEISSTLYVMLRRAFLPFATVTLCAVFAASRRDGT